MSTKEVTFKNSRIIQTSLMLFFIGLIGGYLPEENFTIIFLNFGIAFICTILFFYIWKRYRYESKRYFSLFSYVMIIGISIFFIIPILRTTYSHFAFWIVLLLISIMILLPHLYHEHIFKVVHKPYKYKLGKAFTIGLFLIFTFGGGVYMAILTSESVSGLIASIATFLISTLLLFLAPILLVKPDKVEELKAR
ncbi:hypothetical protein CEY16_08455 [Halalkalibacillus sediminis]|uniref:Uncharacterized protein n=1 Tax=Halalkalibacillus sediminis TaxID=2018042 RepID=A0A2I0QUE2_9BACI|nr:hypothetical protein CEY16_08455 [Halalkalibacillus sediminis]